MRSSSGRRVRGLCGSRPDHVCGNQRPNECGDRCNQTLTSVDPIITSTASFADLQTSYERLWQSPSSNNKNNQRNNQNAVDDRRFKQLFFECDRSNSNARIPHATVGRAAPATNRRRQNFTASLTCATRVGSSLLAAAMINHTHKMKPMAFTNIRALINRCPTGKPLHARDGPSRRSTPIYGPGSKLCIAPRDRNGYRAACRT
jgi:hypothetical protein